MARAISRASSRIDARKEHPMGIMNDTVSVILPYFNRSDTLERAAMSVLNQTYRGLVLILVDDGSSDGSRQVAHSMEDPRIRFVDLTINGGACVARNAGLAAAETSLVAFMDSDDEWFPEKLERQVRELRARQAMGQDIAVIGCAWTYAGAEQHSQALPVGPFNRHQMLRGVAGTGTPALLVDRSHASEGASFDDSFPSLEERDFVISCLANGSFLTVLPEVLLTVYRGRADHLANPVKASDAWERFLGKYSKELDNDPELRSWYHFRAAREFLVARRPTRAARHVPPALKYRPIRRTVHIGLGCCLGAKGLAAAQKVLPL